MENIENDTSLEISAEDSQLIDQVLAEEGGEQIENESDAARSMFCIFLSINFAPIFNFKLMPAFSHSKLLSVKIFGFREKQRHSR